jgi:hypothetical protein
MIAALWLLAVERGGKATAGINPLAFAGVLIALASFSTNWTVVERAAEADVSILWWDSIRLYPFVLVSVLTPLA